MNTPKSPLLTCYHLISSRCFELARSAPESAESAQAKPGAVKGH